MHTWSEAQLDALHATAETAGRYQHLLFFHAARRDMDAVRALEAPAAGHAEDALLHRLLCLADAGETCPGLLADVERIEDPWLAYTIVKYFLGRGDVANALAAPRKILSTGVKDTACLNLIARYLAANKEWKLAENLAQASLRIAPLQRDIVALYRSVAAKKPVAAPRTLDVFPTFERVMFYIPVYNVERHIGPAIEGLMRQSYPLTEVIVVNDGTPDRSMEIAAQYPVRLDGMTENRGLAATRNTAFRATDCNFVGTIDTDAIPEEGYVKYAMMEYEQADTKLALLGGRLREAYHMNPPDAWREVHACQDRGLRRFYLDTHPGPEDDVSEEERKFYKEFLGLHFLCGANTVLRRAPVLELGGYLERLRNNAEDVYINTMLEAAGYHYAFSPHPVAWHQRQDTVLSILRTVWSYNFNGCEDAGFFNSALGIVNLLELHLLDGHNHLSCDIEAKRFPCVYLSFLMCFVHPLSDLRHCTAKKGFPRAQALHIQNRLLSRLQRMNRNSGKDIETKVLGDIREMLLEADVPEEKLPLEAEQMLQGVLTDYDALIDRYSPEFYDILTR